MRSISVPLEDFVFLAVLERWTTLERFVFGILRWQLKIEWPGLSKRLFLKKRATHWTRVLATRLEPLVETDRVILLATSTTSRSGKSAVAGMEDAVADRARIDALKGAIDCLAP